MQPSGIISLTTDFGLTDSYVGQMKGAILHRNPSVQLVDLCHAVPDQDIIGGAIILHSSYNFFPPGTVHLVVIDPGVGSSRRIIAAEGGGHYFVTPDNGILSLLLRDNIIMKVYSVEQRDFFAEAISATFHGRDIMGPVSAILAGGRALYELGPEIPRSSCLCLDIPVAYITESRVEGEVLQVDHFGNIRTSIRETDLQHFAAKERCQVELKGHKVRKIGSTYAEVDPGEMVALLDSAGYLEIAVNKGSAAEWLQCVRGDPVYVDYSPLFVG